MENYEKIETYLNGQMTKEEALEFEVKAEADENLAMEIAVQKFEQEAMELALEDDLRSQIKEIQINNSQKANSDKKNKNC